MRLSSAGEQLVAETMAELGLVERPMIILDDDSLVARGLDGLYEPGPPSVVWVRPTLSSERFREVLRHELYHYWQHRMTAGGSPPAEFSEQGAAAFARRGQEP